MVTGFYAGLLALIYLGLSFLVIKKRLKFGVELGDGGHEGLKRAIRAHANFAEYVPMALLLILFCELSVSSPFGEVPPYIHALAGSLVLARVAQAYGLNQAGVNKFRLVGTVVTFIVIAIAAIIAMTQFLIA